MLKGLNGSLYVAQLGATVVALPPDSGTRRTNFIWNTILGRMWGVYLSLMAVALVATVSLLHKFAAPNVTPFVMIITGSAWLVSFSMIAMVPIDVYVALDRSTSPDALALLWQVSFWSTQLLTWLIIPILQNYSDAGDFTVLGRLKTAIRRLWVFYLVIMVLSIVGIVVAWSYGRLTLSTLPELIITMSNTFGLIVVIGLLGYGLVDIPRVLWRRSFPETRLKWHMHRIGKSAEKLTAASSELQKALAVVLLTRQQVAPANTELLQHANDLVKFAEAQSPVPLKAILYGKGLDVSQLEERDLDYAADEAGLAKLCERLKIAIANFLGFRGEYLLNVGKGLELEAICKSRQHGVYLPPVGNSAGWRQKLTWQYKCRVRPWVQKGASLVAAATSVTLVWSEITIGTGRDPDLSPFSLLVHDPEVKSSQFLEQLVVALPLAYVSLCAYHSLFKLGSNAWYHIVPKATWSTSLLFNGSLLARYAAPLGFNFLHVIRMNKGHAGRVPVFVELYGLQDVPLLGQAFNTWFPAVLVVYMLILATNVCDACANLLIPDNFRFNADRADDVHTLSGSRFLHSEQDALARGGRLGDGTQLFGMTSYNADGSPITLPGGEYSIGNVTSGQSSEGGSGGGLEMSSMSDGAMQMHQPLFPTGVGLHSSSSASLAGAPGGAGGGLNLTQTTTPSSRLMMGSEEGVVLGTGAGRSTSPIARGAGKSGTSNRYQQYKEQQQQREGSGVQRQQSQQEGDNNNRIDELFARVEAGGLGPSRSGAWGGQG